MLTHYDTTLDSPYQSRCALADAYEAAQDAVTDEERDYLSLSALAEADGPMARCIHCGDQFTALYPGCVVCGECDRAEAEAARRYEWQTRQYGECEEAER